MASTIKLKNGSGAPTSGQLVQGEPALDLTNKRLYTENASGTVIEVGVNPAAEITANAGIALPDNQKATFGAGDDLKIYHDGSNSYIEDAGVGNLILKGADIQILASNGDVFFKAFQNNRTELYYDNSDKLRTTSTGIDVTGTVTADGLTVQGDTASALIRTDNPNNTELNFWTRNTADNAIFKSSVEGIVDGGIKITTADTANADPKDRLNISSIGDISFYEDTGTTAKFFWDASAESLGIGTSSPTATLDVFDNAGSLSATKNVTARFRRDDGTNNPRFEIRHSTDGTDLHHTFSTIASNFTFSIGNSEKARIDSSGNLLVGKTTLNSATTVGVELQSDGQIFSIADGRTAGTFVRKTSDGSIVDFRKDSTTVGSIGAFSTSASFCGKDSGIYFNGSNINPTTGNPTVRTDGVLNLGQSTQRFKDLYLSGGVYLGGTGAANLLDDYEEGSFTFTLRDATSGGNTSPTTQTALYMKIGRMVRIELQAAVGDIDTTGMTGGNDLYFDLPFVKGSTEGLGPVMLSSFVFPSGYSYFAAEALAGSVGVIRMGGDNVGARPIKVNEITSGATDITRLSLTYFT